MYFNRSGKLKANYGNSSIFELQQAVIRYAMRLPGNDGALIVL